MTDPLVDRLRAAGCVFAEDEAAMLREAADGDADHLEALTVRRVAGEPLEVVVGWAAFSGLRIPVEPGVFVPRLRTEALVDEAVRLVRASGSLGDEPDAPVVVDLCCGTGAIGAAIADAIRAGDGRAGDGRAGDGLAIDLVAADLDPAAVRVAWRTLAPFGARVFEGDLFDALPADLRGRVLVLTVNAPYVPTDAIAAMPPEARDHEARLALDGGADGVDVHRRVAASARDWLRPGGHLLVEAGSAQAAVTAGVFATAGLTVRVVRDDDRDATVVVGTAPGAGGQPGG